MAFRFAAAIALSACIGLSSGASPAHASTCCAPLSLTKLLQQTEYAFSGIYDHSESFRDSSSGVVLTRVVFRNLHMAYGAAPGDSIDITFLGGVIDDGRGYDPGSVPPFATGTRYITLLGERRGKKTGLAGAAGAMVGWPVAMFRVDYPDSGADGIVSSLAGYPLIAVTDAFEVLERVNAWPEPSHGGIPGGGRFLSISPVRMVASTLPSVDALTERQLLEILAARIPAAKALPPADP